MRLSRPKGITLIEVVAGLALMGTLLVVIIVSSSQHLRQVKSAQHKRESVRLLDNFLASWSVHRFQSSGIQQAARRSGLDVSGHYGIYSGRPVEADAIASGYQVDLQRVGRSEFEHGSIIRLTVSTHHGIKRRSNAAWAEVLVPQ